MLLIIDGCLSCFSKILKRVLIIMGYLSYNNYVDESVANSAGGEG